MKVIFLDIDGVLNCKKTPNPRDFPYIVEAKLLCRLTKLLEKCNARVVLSSTWRYDPIGVIAAKHWGIPFIDVTPDLPHRPRRVEILAWLKRHREVKRFVVIDDDDDGLDDLPLFQPSKTTGLTAKICNGVDKYLAGETNEDMRCGRITRLVQNVRAALTGHPG